LAAEPFVETDAAEARFAQRHERALLDSAAEVSSLGVAHDLTRVAADSVMNSRRRTSVRKLRLQHCIR
jgi:hypothetical protein